MTSSSRSSLPLPLSLAAMLLCLLLMLPVEGEAKSCVFKCMRSVITCKRKAALSGGGSDACCDGYYQCFLGCKPDATKLPPCSSGPGKRSMWRTADDRDTPRRLPSFSDFF